MKLREQNASWPGEGRRLARIAHLEEVVDDPAVTILLLALRELALFRSLSDA